MWVDFLGDFGPFRKGNAVDLVAGEEQGLGGLGKLHESAHFFEDCVGA